MESADSFKMRKLNNKLTPNEQRAIERLSPFEIEIVGKLLDRNFGWHTCVSSGLNKMMGYDFYKKVKTATEKINKSIEIKYTAFSQTTERGEFYGETEFIDNYTFLPHYSEDLNEAIKLWNDKWRCWKNGTTWVIDNGIWSDSLIQAHTLTLAINRAYLIEKMKDEK